MSADPTRPHLHAVEDDAPPLIVVNASTGERMGSLTVVTDAAEAEYNALQGKYRAALAQITKLTKDSEAEARKHERWSEGEALHMWWRLATGRCGRKFGADEFYQALPRLKEREHGPIGVLQAIAGAAYDPGTKQMRNGKTERYDDWELICRSQAKLESFQARAPVGADDHHWKRWLVAHIEAQFKS